VVPAKATVVIFVGPLKPGRYPFFGDFNKDSAKGVLVAK
jgi:Cupredoxin-like domain